MILIGTATRISSLNFFQGFLFGFTFIEKLIENPIVHLSSSF